MVPDVVQTPIKSSSLYQTIYSLNRQDREKMGDEQRDVSTGDRKLEEQGH